LTGFAFYIGSQNNPVFRFAVIVNYRHSLSDESVLLGLWVPTTDTVNALSKHQRRQKKQVYLQWLLYTWVSIASVGNVLYICPHKPMINWI